MSPVFYRLSVVTLSALVAALPLSGCAHKPQNHVAEIPAEAAAPPVSAPKAAPRVHIAQRVLGNGLKVLALEDHSAPAVEVQIWYRVGSREEPAGKRGIAHLLEHLMFKGSKRVAPEAHARIVNAVGGRNNAFTSDDVTAYHDTVPADRLDLALALEAERLADLRLDESHFFKEREVVKEEIRLRQQNDPFGALFEKFRAVAYKQHPYGVPVGGTLADLDAISIDDVRAFHARYYVPSNAVLVVVGDFSTDEAMKRVDQHFGSLPAGTRPAPVHVTEPEQTAARVEELRFPTQLPVVLAGYKIPGAAHADMPVIDVIGRILGDGQSSRLHRALVREQRLAAFAGSFNMSFADPGLLMSYAAFLPSSDPAKVREALLAEIARFASEGPTEAELGKAKNQLTASFLFGLTSLGNMAHAIGEAELVEGDYRRFAEKEHAYDAITVDEVKRVAQRYLVSGRMTLLTLLPPEAGQEVKKEKGQKVAEAERETREWPTLAPFVDLPATEARAVELPPVHREKLANGLTVLVVQRRELPLVYFDLRVPGGAFAEPAGKAGLGDLLAATLTQGTRHRDADSIANAVDGMGGSIDASSSTEFFELSGQFLKRDFDRGLDIFSDAALFATFPDDEVEKARPAVLSTVRVTRDEPTSLAMQHLSSILYGCAHPRGRVADLGSVKAVQAADLRAVYKQAFTPRTAILVVTGDVDVDEVRAAVGKEFGGWSGGEGIALDVASARAGKAGLRLVDKPDLTQSTLAVGELGIERSNPDWAAMVLGNYVLGGGGFSSRLMKELRSKAGKTYGAGSFFVAGRSAGPIMAYTFTRVSETQNTLDMLRAEIRTFAKSGITEDELQDAKNHLAGSYALKLQSPLGVGHALLAAQFYGLGDNWVRDYPLTITGPDLKTVNAAIKRHLHPKKMSTVIVGPVAGLKKVLKKKLRRAPVVAFDAPVCGAP